VKKLSDCRVLLVGDAKANLDILVEGLKPDYTLSVGLCRRLPIRPRALSNKANNNSAVSASPLSIFMKIQTRKPMR
jgi:hypothetical protein